MSVCAAGASNCGHVCGWGTDSYLATLYIGGMVVALDIQGQ